MLNPAARRLIADQISIPSLPLIVQKIERLLADPDAGAIELGALISEDPALAAKVLKIANSSYYGLNERCLQPQQATTILGTRVLRNVVTQAAVMKRFEHLRGGAYDVESVWRHSIVTAQTVQFLGRRCRRPIGVTPDEVYACGLLHDLGEIVMLEGLGQAFVDVALQARAQRMPAFLAERRAFGFDHTDVGHLVATQWGLPPAIADAIAFHHGPREKLAGDPLVALVANTNLLVGRVAEGNLAGAANVFDARTLAQTGLTPEIVEEVVAFVGESLSTVEV